METDVELTHDTGRQLPPGQAGRIAARNRPVSPILAAQSCRMRLPALGEIVT